MGSLKTISVRTCLSGIFFAPLHLLPCVRRNIRPPFNNVLASRIEMAPVTVYSSMAGAPLVHQYSASSVTLHEESGTYHLPDMYLVPRIGMEFLTGCLEIAEHAAPGEVGRPSLP